MSSKLLRRQLKGLEEFIAKKYPVAPETKKRKTRDVVESDEPATQRPTKKRKKKQKNTYTSEIKVVKEDLEFQAQDRTQTNLQVFKSTTKASAIKLNSQLYVNQLLDGVGPLHRSNKSKFKNKKRK
eukprot:TRINITY_DN13554_c0_g1_i1.p1 TRINITY_DN13554_c0_g1~~TRINITY_DN13554_c0_g1_i1.p1  ORF type:complete len:126 (+),score=23.68 TRINITY_DN13554_c0_g1_i1:101-478(+)